MSDVDDSRVCGCGYRSFFRCTSLKMARALLAEQRPTLDHFWIIKSSRALQRGLEEREERRQNTNLLLRRAVLRRKSLRQRAARRAARRAAEDVVASPRRLASCVVCRVSACVCF